MPQNSDCAIFPDARMLHDGCFTTPQGNLVMSNYVDLSGALPLDGFSLAKASEPRFHLRASGTIRLSRPALFRTTGEVLVKDDQEGEARTTTRNTAETPGEQADLDRAQSGGFRGRAFRPHEAVRQRARQGEADEHRRCPKLRSARTG